MWHNFIIDLLKHETDRAVSARLRIQAKFRNTFCAPCNLLVRPKPGGEQSFKPAESEHAPLGEVYGEPNCRLSFRRPRYAMETTSGDQDIVTRTKIALTFSLDPHTG